MVEGKGEQRDQQDVVDRDRPVRRRAPCQDGYRATISALAATMAAARAANRLPLDGGVNGSVGGRRGGSVVGSLIGVVTLAPA
jgi:hypothetical protein